MASGALFGNSSNRSQSKNLVEFRAGKMNLKSNNMVHADKRKGLVYIYQSEDSLMHLCWKDRNNGTVEDDLIIFPDDCEFVPVKQCKTGRAFLLRFQSTGRKQFFWMQEPKDDKDEEYCRKVNDLLNNPPQPGSNRGGGSGLAGLGGLPSELTAGLSDGDIQSLLGNMNQNQLMQLLGMGGSSMSGLLGSSARPASSESGSRSSAASRTTAESSSSTSTTTTAATSSATATTTTASSSSGGSKPSDSTSSETPAASSSGGQPKIQLADLQNILTGMMGPAAAAGGKPQAVDLALAMSHEVMVPILANKEVQERLIPFLPEGEDLPKTEEQLKATVQSPQFQQALSSFSVALSSGQLGPLIGQFDLGAAATEAAEKGDVEAFAKAIQAGKEKEESEKSETSEKKSDDTQDKPTEEKK